MLLPEAPVAASPRRGQALPRGMSGRSRSSNAWPAGARARAGARASGARAAAAQPLFAALAARQHQRPSIRVMPVAAQDLSPQCPSGRRSRTRSMRLTHGTSCGRGTRASAVDAGGGRGSRPFSRASPTSVACIRRAGQPARPERCREGPPRGHRPPDPPASTPWAQAW